MIIFTMSIKKLEMRFLYKKINGFGNIYKYIYLKNAHSVVVLMNALINLYRLLILLKEQVQ